MTNFLFNASKIIISLLLIEPLLFSYASGASPQLSNLQYVPNGEVFSVANSGNTVYLGGNFTRLVDKCTGDSRGALCSLSTGGLHCNFPKVNGTINAVAYDGINDIWYIGGNFTRVGSYDLTNLARIFGDGTVDDYWYTEPDGIVNTLYLDGNDNILYVGGEFTTMADEPRNFIAAFSTTDGSILDWVPDADNVVHTIYADDSSNVYVGGEFTYIGGISRNYLARLNSSGFADSWNPNPDSFVKCILPLDTTVYIGGDFTNMGDSLRLFLAAVDITNGISTSWAPSPDNQVSCLALFDTTLIIGGIFENIGGAARNYLAEIDLLTGQTTSWNPSPGTGSDIRAIGIADSTIFVGGAFNSIGGSSRNNFAEIRHSDGATTGFNLDAENTVHCIALSDNDIYIGGEFKGIGGFDRKNLAAIDVTTGNVTNWTPDPNGWVTALAVSSSEVYAGGAFNTIGGQNRNNVAAIDTAGNATSWDPGASSSITQIHVIKVNGNNIYIGGNFWKIGGQIRKYLAAVDKTSGNATSWNPDCNDQVRAIDVSGGIVYAGGDFTMVNTSSRAGLAAIDTANGLPTSWNPMNAETTSTVVKAVKVNRNLVYIGGTFNNIGSLYTYGLAAIDTATGEPLSTWVPVFSWGGVNTIDIIGNILYAGGDLVTVINDEYRQYLAVISLSTGELLDWDAKINSDFYGRINSVSINPQNSTLYFGYLDIDNILEQPASYFSGITLFPTIETGTISSSTFYPGDSVNVPYSVFGSFDVLNTFYVELSDSTGVFDGSNIIGSVSGTSSGTISVIIPADSKIGTHYRIRVNGDYPTSYGTDNETDLTILGFWSRKADFGGTARSAATGFSIGSKAYIGMGYDGSTKKDFWEYNSLTDGWTQKADYSGTAAYSPISFSIGNKGYMGTGYDGSTKRADFWEYNPSSNTWAQKANFGAGGRNAGVGFSIGSKGYIGTGNGSGFQNDFWEYNTTTNGWTQKTNFGGSGRDGAVGFAIGEKGYIGLGNGGSYYKDFWEYNPADNSWTQKSDFGGVARDGATCFSIGSKGYVGIGYDGSSHKNDYWEYDPLTNLWTQKENFAGVARGSSVGFSIGNKGYVGTGSDGTNQKDFYQYYDPANVAINEENISGTFTPGQSISLPYTAYGTFNEGNVFTLQLSDSNGYWSSPDDLGALTSTSSGTITGLIPYNQSAGTNYLVRVISSNPACIGLTNGIALTIQGYWTRKADFAGGTRTAAAGFSIGTKGYIGTGNNSPFTQDFWEYNPSTNVWTQKIDFGGVGRYVATGFSVANKGYIGTGYGGGYKNDFWEYNPSTNTWTQKANLGSVGRLMAVSFGIGSKGYIGTGDINGIVSNDFWEYSPSTDVWTQKANFGGQNRDAAAGFSIGSKGYIGLGAHISNYSDFWEYDPATNSWTQKANMGDSLSYATGFSIGNKGYYCSGRNTNSNNVSSLWEYNQLTNSWTQKESYGGGVRELSVGFSIGNKAYMGTGVGTSGLTNDFWQYYDPENVAINEANISGTFTPGQSISLPYTAYGTFNGSNSFTIQLSDSNGYWGSPTTIGTLTSTSSGTISGTLPANPTSSTNYLVRVISSTPACTGLTNGIALTITPSLTTGVISGSPFCAGQTILVPYTAGNGSFNTGNIFTIQMSDGTGSFAAPTSVGSLASLASGTIICVIPIASPTNTGYRFRVTSSNPSLTSNDNGTDILINAMPNPVISGNNVVCSLSSQTYSTAFVLGTSNSWTVLGGIINGSPTGTVVNITWGGGSSGTVSLLQTVNSTGCNKYVQYPVTINPLPTPNITGLDTTCENSTNNYSTTLVGGHTYQWLLSNGVINGSYTGSTVNITVGTGTSSTLTVVETIIATGCANSSSKVIYLNPLPNPTITGNNFVCALSSQTYSTAFVAGTSNSWTVSGGIINGSPTGTVVNIDWGSNISGTVSLLQTLNATGCNILVQYPVTINSIPTPYITGADTVCTNSTNVYSTSITGGHTYQWSLVNGAISGPSTNSSVNFTVGTGTSATLTLVETIATTGCSNSFSKIIYLNPLPAASISGNLTVCDASSSVYNGAGIAGTSYSWSITGGGTIIGPSNQSSVNIGWFTGSLSAATATITLTQTYVTTGCQKTVTQVVLIEPLPTPSITGSNVVCEASSQTYYTTTVAGDSYSWSVTGGSIQGSATNPNVNILWGGGGSGTITLIETINATGCNKTVTQNITINPLSTQTITGLDSVCATNTYSYSTSSVAGTTNSWFVTGGSIIGPSNQTTVNVTWGSSNSGTVSLTQTVVTTGCNNTVSKIIFINPLPTPNIIGNLTVCNQSTQTYSTSASGVSNQWYVTNGTIIGPATGSSIDVYWNTSLTGIVKLVQTANGSGCIDSISKSITVNQLPPVSITGNDSVCATNIYSYFANAVTGTTNQWSIAGGTISGSSTGSSVLIIWGSGSSGTVTLTKTITATGCQSASNKAITINPLPTPNINGNDAVCSLSTNSYNTTAILSTSNKWYVNGGSIYGQSNGSNVTITWGTSSSGTILLVQTTISGCKDSTYKTITINSLPQPQITGYDSVCVNSTSAYSTPTIQGYTNQWSVVGGMIIGSATGNTVNINWGSFTTGTIKLIQTIARSGCIDSTTKNVTINSLPTPTISGPDNACAGIELSYSTPQVSNATNLWSITGGTFTSPPTGNSVMCRWLNAETGVLKILQVINSSGCNDSTTKTVQIEALPQVNINGPNSVPKGTLQSYSTNPVTGVTNNWSVTGGTISGSSTNEQCQVNWGDPGQGTVKLVKTSSSGCKDSISLNITINNSLLNISGNTVVCKGSSDFYWTSHKDSTSNEWFAFNGIINGSNKGDSINIEWTGQDTGRVKLVNTITATGYQDSIIIDIFIKQAPVANITGSSMACPGSIQKYYTKYSQGAKESWSVIGGSVVGNNDKDSVYIQWSQPGIGIVKLVRENISTGCKDSSNQNITINPLPTPAIDGKNKALANTAEQYSTTSSQGVTNRWEISGGTISGSASWATIYVLWGNVGQGRLKLVQTIDVTGCSDSTYLDINVTNQSEDYKVSGKVADASTGVGIDNAIVEFISSSGIDSVTTSTGGDYSLTLNNRNIYIAKASVPLDTSFLSQYYYLVDNFTEATPLDLVADKSDVNFALQKKPDTENRLFGNVISQTGDSVPSQVIAFIVFPADSGSIPIFACRTYNAIPTNGKFDFSSLVAGKYVLLAMPASEEIAPGYYNSGGLAVYTWKLASLIELQSNATVGPVDIILENVLPISGEGIIAGKIILSDSSIVVGKGGDIPIAKEGVAGAVVVSKDDKNNVRKYNISNIKGNFKIDSLSEGKYKLLVDKIGLSPMEIDFEITSDNIAIEENLELNKQEPSIIGESDEQGGQDFAVVYPNPASNNFTIEFKSFATKARFIMYNLLGKKVFEAERDTKTGVESFAFSNIKLMSGMYLVKIRSGKKEYNVRVIIKE